MKRFLSIAAAALMVAGIAFAEDDAKSGGGETVPATTAGGSHKIKEGGKEIGAGFRAIGRGIKDVFTGEKSKDDFKEAAKIGEGARDVGVGTAGVGRGVGRDVKKGFEGEDAEGEAKATAGGTGAEGAEAN
jgi:hypothetical protein